MGGWRAAIGAVAAGVVTTVLPMAKPAHAAFVSVPLENLTISPSNAGTVLTQEFGHQKLLLWSNGSASATVELPERSVALEIGMDADLCAGGPVVRVSVDGQAVLDHSVTTSAHAVVVAEGDWAAGTHHVSVRFLNDYRDASCDRNVKLDYLAFLSFWDPPRLSLSAADLTLVPPDAGGIYHRGDLGTPTLKLWSNGRAVADVFLQRTFRLQVIAAPDACDGPPQMEVWFDGVLVIEQAVTTSVFATATDDWPAGSHHVEIAFVNDLRTASCDRNLKILDVSFSGDPGYL